MGGLHNSVKIVIMSQVNSSSTHPSQPQKQQQKIDHYILGQTLGSGAFAKVRLAAHEYTGSKVAIKIIKKSVIKSHKMSVKIEREIRLMRYFNHPNLIKLYQVLDADQNIFVVMEYVNGGELFNLVNEGSGLDEVSARKYFRQIIDGVEHCHQHLVCHRDLKLENILVDDKGHVKIADFGLSNIMKDGKFLKTSCGSLYYAPPEIVIGKSYTGAEVDIWSCGVILFAMLTGTLPFADDNTQVTIEKISKAEYKCPSSLPPDAKDLIAKILKVNPMERISISEIRRHPWFMSSDQTTFVLKDYTSKDENTKINEVVFGQLMDTKKFDFKGLKHEEVKEAIRTQRNHSFVVGYQLLLSDFNKDNKPVESHTDQVFFGPIKEYLDSHQKELNLYFEKLLHERESSDWQYGIRLPLTASETVRLIYDTLPQIGVVLVFHQSSVSFKCTYNLANSPYHQNHMLEENEAEDEARADDPNKISFSLQIYKISPNLHLIDPKLKEGNPIAFLDLTHKIKRALKVH